MKDGKRIPLKEHFELVISVLDDDAGNKIWNEEELYKQKIRIQKIISDQGSTCLAYEGELLSRNKPWKKVIIKQFYPKASLNYDLALENFLTGYQKQKKMSNWPELAEVVVKPLILGRDEQTYYIISEKHEGKSLDLKTIKTLDTKLNILEQLADLYYILEKQECIFVDVCPDNILYTEQGRKTRRLFLFDMNGIVEKSEISTMRLETLGCHDEYAAPMLLALKSGILTDRKYISQEATWYSLGVMAVELLFGRQRFETGPGMWKGSATADMIQYLIKNYHVTRSVAEDLIEVLQMLIPDSYPNYGISSIEAVCALLENVTKRLHHSEYIPKEKKERASETYQCYQLLEAHPVFQYAKKEGGGYILDVCLVGKDSMRAAMLHALISIVQMLDSELRIHIIAEDAIEFWNEYTSEKMNPGLAGAVCLYENGKKSRGSKLDRKMVKEPLAHIHLHTEDRIENIKDVMEEYDCHYVVLLHNQLYQNLEYKEKLAACVGNQNREERYFFAYLDEETRKYGKDNLTVGDEKIVSWPIYTEQISDYYNEANYRERMDQIGLAVHSYYYKQSQPFASDEEIKKDYGSSIYYQESSQRCGLHLIYKLASVGITEKSDPHLLKEIYAQIFDAASTERNKEKLAWLEHRSWCGYMLTRGAKRLAMEDFAACAYKNGNTWKDERNPYHVGHPFLVPGTLESEIQEKDWARDEAKKNWDLLDKTSFELHKQIRTIALDRKSKIDGQLELVYREIKIKNNEINNCFKKLKKAKENCYRCLADVNLEWRPALYEWRLALEAWNDICAKYLQNTSEMKQELRELKEDMAPVLDALKRTDFKKKDVEVILAIPSMIADIWEEVRENMILVRPVTNAVWDNIGSTLLLEPKRLIMLSDDDQPVDTKFYKKFLKQRGLDHIKISQTYRKEAGDRIYLDFTGLDKKQVFQVCQDERWKDAIAFDLEDDKNESWNCIYMTMLERSMAMTIPEACYLLKMDGRILDHRKDHGLSKILWEEYQSVEKVRKKFQLKKWNLFVGELEQMSRAQTQEIRLAGSELTAHTYRMEEIYGEYLKRTGLGEILEELEERNIISSLAFPATEDEGEVLFTTKHADLAETIRQILDQIREGNTKFYKWNLTKADSDFVKFENESLYVRKKIPHEKISEQEDVCRDEFIVECLKNFMGIVEDRQVFQSVKTIREEDGITIILKYATEQMKYLLENCKNMCIVKEYLEAVRSRRYDDIRIVTNGGQTDECQDKHNNHPDLMAVTDGIVCFLTAEQGKDKSYRIKTVSRKI